MADGWTQTLLGADSKTPRQIITEQRRTIVRSATELERHKFKEEQRQARIIGDIQRAARKNDYDNAALGAHNLVQSRKTALKLGKMVVYLKSLESRFAMMNASNSLSAAVSGVVKALSAMKSAMSADDLARLLREFDAHQRQLEERQSSMEAALDAATSDANDVKAEREVVDKIFAEIGIDTAVAFAAVPAVPRDIHVASNNTAAAAASEAAAAAAADAKTLAEGIPKPFDISSISTTTSADDDDLYNGQPSTGTTSTTTTQTPPQTPTTVIVYDIEKDLQQRLDAMKNKKTT